MSLTIASLNSGSNGNCYYIGNSEQAVFIDAGLSCRETERRMLRLGLSLRKVKAIFVSHEHCDHIKGVEVLSKKYSLPVYISEATYNNSRMKVEVPLLKTLNIKVPVQLGNLTIEAFHKLHDAIDPHSFTVESEGVKVGIFTDIGAPCPNIIHHFSRCHAAFLESNYDEKMLSEGGYPYYLQQRIRSDKGHLSNHQALELFNKYKAPFLSHLLLSHLSKDNNCPNLAKDLFLKHCGNTQITVASRHQESEVFVINSETSKTSNSEGQQLPIFQ